MAGMFYSLQEAAEKLNKTEEEIKQIVQEGNLREFRDGPNLLFKVEEVEALMSEASEEALEAVELEPEALEPEALEPEALEPEIPELEGLEAEKPEAEALEPEIPEAEDIELDIPVDENPELEALEAEMLAPAEEAAGTSEILLAPETGAPLAPNESELTNADTALTGEGINVLGESGGDFEITDDTLAETAIPMSTTGTGPEMPLEEIEGDVNLDSFGSGSGLLDLSLQADDTSLGGILDEIYTDEVEGAEGAFEEAGADSAAALAAEAGEMLDEEVPIIAHAAPEVPMALGRPYVEAAPDMQSNVLGMLLFLPFFVIIYTAVVAVSGQRELMPSILSSVRGFIWYIMGGFAVLALLVAGVAFMTGGDGSAKVKKAKKPKAKKAPKAPKAKKEKKPKKEKKAKEPKPKKAKKEKKKKK